MILSALGSFFSMIWSFIKESAAYKILERIYLAVSGSWKRSRIMTAIEKRRGCEIAKNSVSYKVLRIPFTILEKIGAAAGEWVDKQIKSSCIVRIGRIFTESCLALNARFLSCLFLSMFAGCAVVMIFKGVSYIALAIGVLGVILLLFGDHDLMEYLNHSAVVTFIKNACGFYDESFSFYKKGTLSKAALAVAAAVGFVSGLLSYATSLLTIAAPVGIFGVCLILAYPITGVFASVIVAPVGPTMALAGICILTTVSTVIHAWRTQSFRWKFEGVGLGFMLLLAVLLVASVTSFDVANSCMVWIMYLVFVGFYFIIVNTVKTKEQLFALCKTFVIVGAFIALYGVLQYIFGWNTSNAWIDEEMFEESTMRAYSTMGNPNVLGEYLLLTIPLSAVFMIKYEWNRLAKWAYMGIFALSMLCMVFTQSRGCWLGIMLTAFVFVTFYNGRWWKLLPLAIVALVFLIPETFADRLMSIGDTSDSSTSYRVFIWLGTLDMLKFFWLGGIGMGEGAFGVVYPFYSYNAIIAPHSHNTYLQLAVSAGIGALLTFVITMCVFLKKISDAFHAFGEKSAERALAAAIGAGTLGFLLQSMFDYTFYNYRMMAMFFMFTAFGIVLHGIASEGETK